MMVRTIAGLLCAATLTCGDTAEDGLSLLQVSAVKKHIAEDEGHEESFPHLHILPCLGTSVDSTMKDRDLKICRAWGDVHPSTTFLDETHRIAAGAASVHHNHASTPYQFAQLGVSRIAKACSGKWEIQMFQIPCGGVLGCQQGAAIKVGSLKFELYSLYGNKDPSQVKCFMGQEGKEPCTASGSHKGVTWSWSTSAFCLEYKNQVALTVHKFDWGHAWDMIVHVPKSVCTTKEKNMCGGREMLNEDGKSCNDDGTNCRPKPGQIYVHMPEHEISSSEQLFSAAALDILCKRGRDRDRGTERLTYEDCNFPEEPPESVEDNCVKNGNKFSDAEATCNPLQKKGYDAFYEDCLIDECAVPGGDKDEEEDIELIAAETAEANTCVNEPCNDQDICDAIGLTLDEVHSNLGGLGPDSGAEEMRFSNVASVGGAQTDLVIVSNNKYKPKKPENNAVTNGIGVINLDGGQSVSLTFSLVKSGTNEEVTLDVPFKMSFVDVDKGKSGNVEHLTVCGAQNIYMREVNELETEAASTEGCQQVYAAAPGTGADNPESLELTEAQKLKSFDITVSKASFTLELEVKEKKGRMSARNFMFGGQSVIGNCE